MFGLACDGSFDESSQWTPLGIDLWIGSIVLMLARKSGAPGPMPRSVRCLVGRAR